MDEEDEKEAPKSKSGSWKPQVHFVWDILLDEVLSEDDSESSTRGSFPEFFRILVDGTLHALYYRCFYPHSFEILSRISVFIHIFPRTEVLGIPSISEGPTPCS